MVTNGNNEEPISARQALIRVGSTAAVGGAIGGFYLVTGWGIPCPFRAVTGWLCPFCGGTHLAAALLRGDVVSAWGANPLLLIVALMVGVRTVGWLVEYVRTPAAASLRWLPVTWSRQWFGVVAVVSVAYVLVRNLA